MDNTNRISINDIDALQLLTDAQLSKLSHIIWAIQMERDFNKTKALPFHLESPGVIDDVYLRMDEDEDDDWIF
jgi:hypothetical protein